MWRKGTTYIFICVHLQKVIFYIAQMLPDKCPGNSQYFHCGWHICHRWDCGRSRAQMGTPTSSPRAGVDVWAAGRTRRARVIDHVSRLDLYLNWTKCWNLMNYTADFTENFTKSRGLQWICNVTWSMEEVAFQKCCLLQDNFVSHIAFKVGKYNCLCLSSIPPEDITNTPAIAIMLSRESDETWLWCYIICIIEERGSMLCPF